MVGGNPAHDVFGFRHWNRGFILNPISKTSTESPTASRVSGAPFAEYIKEGDLGRFLGFLACFIQASFTIAGKVVFQKHSHDAADPNPILGPDYVAMTAGEAERPRTVLPRAFRGVSIRLTTFFILGSLCIGIVVPYNDPDLLNAISKAVPGAGSSPYVIAMQRLGIPVLPHIVNALILWSVFSAGNSYVYCASRTLYGLALEGKAPKLFTKCTKSGIPVFSVTATLVIALSGKSLSSDQATSLELTITFQPSSKFQTMQLLCFNGLLTW